MLAIRGSTPKQFWRYAAKIASPNSRGTHSTVRDCRLFKSFDTHIKFPVTKVNNHLIWQFTTGLRLSFDTSITIIFRPIKLCHFVLAPLKRILGAPMQELPRTTVTFESPKAIIHLFCFVAFNQYLHVRAGDARCASNTRISYNDLTNFNTEIETSAVAF